MNLIFRLLLARGRDRLETLAIAGYSCSIILLLLARGRDRLETTLYYVVLAEFP